MIKNISLYMMIHISSYKHLTQKASDKKQGFFVAVFCGPIQALFVQLYVTFNGGTKKVERAKSGARPARACAKAEKNISLSDRSCLSTCIFLSSMFHSYSASVLLINYRQYFIRFYQENGAKRLLFSNDLSFKQITSFVQGLLLSNSKNLDHDFFAKFSNSTFST
jgi:hypothetical protein